MGMEVGVTMHGHAKRKEMGLMSEKKWVLKGTWCRERKGGDGHVVWCRER